MLNLSLWDHAFALVVFLVYPVYSFVTIKSALADIRERGERGRISVYKEIILTWIVFSICVFAIWILFDREWAELGFRLVSAVPLAVGLAIAAIFISLFIIPMRNMSRSPERIGDLASEMGDFGLFMPRSKTEEFWFMGVSINAGLFEELIFRGYLIWYLGHFVGPWWAAAIAALWFALAHSYQGLKQLPGVLLVSVVAVALFVYTRSLVVPVLFHIALDALQGHYIAKIQRLQTSVV